MEIPKATDEDKEFFRSLLPDAADVEVKPMFGNTGAFVHGICSPGCSDQPSASG